MASLILPLIWETVETMTLDDLGKDTCSVIELPPAKKREE